jgi:hypothetical protein
MTAFSATQPDSCYENRKQGEGGEKRFVAKPDNLVGSEKKLKQVPRDIAKQVKVHRAILKD